MAKGAFTAGKAGAMGAGYAATGIGKAVGTGGKRILNEALSNPVRLGSAVVGAGALGYSLAEADKRNDAGFVAGKAAVGMAAMSAIPGAAAVGSTLAVGAAGVGTASLGAIGALGRASIKMPKEPLSLNNISDMKFTKFGGAMLIGSSLVEGSKKAIRKYETMRMGQHDGQMRKATPVLPQVDRNPSYANNGGATGDLVFSMYNNR